MLAFSPLASAPVADNGAGIRLSGITTGSPVVGISTLSECNILTPAGITSGQPTLTTSDIEILASSLSADNILSGSPVIEAADITENNILGTVGITAGQPELTTSDLVETVLDLNDILSGEPVVQAVGFTQEGVYACASILTGIPNVGGTELQFKQGHIFVGERLFLDGVANSTGDFTEGETLPAKRITARTPEVQSAVFSHQLSFVADDVTSGAVVVSGGVLSEEETLIPAGDITTGNSEVVTGEFIQVHPFDGEDLVTVPAVSITEMTMVETEIFSAADITTGNTVVKVAYINGSLRRTVDIDFDTTNNVTFSYEYNIAV